MTANCKLVMQNDQVAIRPDKPSEKTAGGLYLPGKVAEKKGRLEWGTVVSVGPGKVYETGERIACNVVVGDHVLFHRSYYDVEVGGEKFLILKDNEIVAREIK